MTAVIFVTAISEFDQKLYEDASTNRMDEALVPSFEADDAAPRRRLQGQLRVQRRLPPQRHVNILCDLHG